MFIIFLNLIKTVKKIKTEKIRKPKVQIQSKKNK